VFPPFPYYPGAKASQHVGGAGGYTTADNYRGDGGGGGGGGLHGGGGGGSGSNGGGGGGGSSYADSSLTDRAVHDGVQSGSGAINLTYRVTTTPPLVTLQPADETVSEGVPASFTAAADGATSVQWQISHDLQNWSDVTGATQTSLIIATQGGQSAKYRAAFTNTGGTTYTNAARLRIMRAMPGSGDGGPLPGGSPAPGATPELDSLLLFGSGLSGLGGYALMRLRARRRRQD
jgi:hypothetical protein